MVLRAPYLCLVGNENSSIEVRITHPGDIPFVHATVCTYSKDAILETVSPIPCSSIQATISFRPFYKSLSVSVHSAYARTVGKENV